MNSTPPPATARLFLALDLPADARAGIGRWRDAVEARHDQLRPVRDEALHVTLVFIGRRPAELVDLIWRTAAASLTGLTAPTLTPTGLRAVPPRRSRLVALDLEDQDGRAAALHTALGSSLQDAGLHEPERRPFWPHVTLARVAARARLRKEAWPAPPIPLAPFTAPRVTLYRSDLHPAGARYVSLGQVEM